MLFFIAAAFASSNPSMHAEKAADGRHEITDRFDERVQVGRTSSPDGGSDGVQIDAAGPGGLATAVLSGEDLEDPERVRAAFFDLEAVLEDLPALIQASGIDLCVDLAGLDQECPW